MHFSITTLQAHFILNYSTIVTNHFMLRKTRNSGYYIIQSKPHILYFVSKLNHINTEMETVLNVISRNNEKPFRFLVQTQCNTTV